MAESKVRDENYFQISGFMINRLGLKGVPLCVYAIIYGFTQDGETEFTGSLQYLCDFTGGTSKQTIINALKSLVKSEYIFKREEIVNGVKFNRYKANLHLLKNFTGGSKEILPGVVKIFEQGGKENLPNNIGDNNGFDNKEISISDEFETLWKLYPKKQGKANALKSYQKARKSGVTFEQVKQGIENYNAEIRAKKTAAEFIKHGSTWFNGECWNDEYGSKPTNQFANLKGGLTI